MIDRDIFFNSIDKELGTEDRDRIEWAYSLAKYYHRPQVRDSGERYFEHCKSVAMILIEFAPTSPSEIIMGLLHDICEDQFVPRGMMRQLFGEKIDEGLKLLSNQKTIFRTMAKIEKIDRPKEEYFAMLMDAPLGVRKVKLADRLHNLKTLGECAPEKIKRKVAETEKYIFPLAKKTDSKLFEAIRKECKKFNTK
ncbi:MAG: hypothetical protein A3B86_00695 [Candidatus Yanofskybacteria bacterium RIFCSPHIGHO2_02_FULL_38_22b]|uniref:HD/PDEase domain-containing protein n=1 Tax=Candidatus Yanofskybacteria bacterium RIFCSPHIGHO2_02_FULL_38_22b TaxID=1802673 RepID=A0A1F8F4J9_9BACT|nr:MAG: hypothetical protein A2816_03570 [Candidatus Yanofskybacteria bacterium RIFCSPHIGHO2_01_FULL_39_44]OGN07598.1 MAG: hypothetical protein A3B86_00695 [Candidatus Yanofskybacteria bacterium RIFCSPHIGHO2_02_FULL_38_22b]OGN20227.1 MAG: hypothetical protein A2910_00230 [Candidatus Yanofskybacteria bacterium RIFCSPLOWO2_01_FULL_39_28]